MLTDRQKYLQTGSDTYRPAEILAESDTYRQAEILVDRQ
jgi:hypothetical protein